MATATTTRTKKHRSDPQKRRPPGRAGGTRLVVAAAIGGTFFLALLFAVFSGSGGDGPSANASGYAYAVGAPGPGEPAPPMRLASTSGGEFDLDDAEGERVLLYFQEGVMCQPCWDQLSDIESRWGAFESLGIDRIVSITSDPLDVLRDKVALEALETPLLSDPGVRVSATYEANQYGMMGDSMNGHSFVVVGPSGEVEWRADYGGAPNYTMYLPVDALLADLSEGLSDPNGATE